jgi:hypothetical protein
MKCKDCKVFGCQYRTTDAEKDCYYERWNVKQFDWQSFRAEAAKDILCAMIQDGYYGEDIIAHQSELAVGYANELVKQLKEKEDK